VAAIALVDNEALDDVVDQRLHLLDHDLERMTECHRGVYMGDE
jgi:hypothetical protein